MGPVIPRLPKRNVEVYDSNSNVIAGFWQYGTLQWDEFYRYLTAFVLTDTAWAIFQFDLTQRQHESHYGIRGHASDGKCLITGLQTQTYSRLKVVHIFPRAHDAEWISKGYPGEITDTADVGALGGPSKIDSLQNLITLRSDLRNAWDNYEFGVDPDPLRELFIDHFMQGLLKHVKGLDEPVWTYEDCEDAFDGGSVDLSKLDIWGTGEGKELFELALADRLLDHHVHPGDPLPPPLISSEPDVTCRRDDNVVQYESSDSCDSSSGSFPPTDDSEQDSKEGIEEEELPDPGDGGGTMGE
ncbi:hypothetical protein BJ322DRAFT_1108373 [Thelephora terrestris]|uniref:HNH nuclease domain-containing protein n=1 Tax=Thelephora terrestris TaxID=56493 RepID=A0A9P6HDG8_9AGAM|nr:hypothetical protein BJ322DRAFT_1108373 [Thelephora terrestris]